MKEVPLVRSVILMRRRAIEVVRPVRLRVSTQVLLSPVFVMLGGDNERMEVQDDDKASTLRLIDVVDQVVHVSVRRNLEAGITHRSFFHSEEERVDHDPNVAESSGLDSREVAELGGVREHVPNAGFVEWTIGVLVDVRVITLCEEVRHGSIDARNVNSRLEPRGNRIRRWDEGNVILCNSQVPPPQSGR